jgi:hypothetical protein
VLFALMGPTVSVPESAFAPDQAPLAAQDAAPTLDQVRVTVPPTVTDAVLALSVSSGGAGVGGGVGVGVTVTTTDLSVVPPDPVHDSPNVVVAESGPMLVLPDAVLLPAHAPTPPVPVQPFAFALVQASVVDPPLATLAGFALRVTSGAAGTLLVTPLKPGATDQPGF